MRLFALAVTIVLLGCADPLPEAGVWSPSDHPQPPRGEIDPSRVAQPVRPERPTDPLAAGVALYNVSCASCHGRSGRGDGPAAGSLGALANFADPAWQEGISDEAIAAVIAQGRNMMPAFAETIPPSGVQALVAVVRRFGEGQVSHSPTTQADE